MQPQHLLAAEARTETGHAAADGVDVDAQTAGCGVGGEHVVRVVHAAEPGLEDRAVAGGQPQRVEPRRLDALQRVVRPGAGEVARGAGVRATVG